MIMQSQFVRHWLECKGQVPESIRASIALEAKNRITARLGAGRADSPLDFRDLCDKLESAKA